MSSRVPKVKNCAGLMTPFYPNIKRCEFNVKIVRKLLSNTMTKLDPNATLLVQLTLDFNMPG